MRTIGTIQGAVITELDDKSVVFTADADIDCDGGNNPEGDPYWQADTSLHFKGKPIDAETVPYVVVPPLIIKGVKGVVMGCAAIVTYKGRSCDAVVADQGPRTKIGEISVACAKALGMRHSPINGGEDKFIVHYQIFPGTPATVNGVTYKLQPA